MKVRFALVMAMFDQHYQLLNPYGQAEGYRARDESLFAEQRAGNHPTDEGQQLGAYKPRWWRELVRHASPQFVRLMWFG